MRRRDGQHHLLDPPGNDRQLRPLSRKRNEPKFHRPITDTFHNARRMKIFESNMCSRVAFAEIPHETAHMNEPHRINRSDADGADKIVRVFKPLDATLDLEIPPD